MATTFVSPIRPRPKVRLMPSADELLGQRPKSDRLFASEEGGREPKDSPASPALASQFGFSMGTPTAQTDNRAARAGVLSRGYKPSLSDPGGDRRAERNAGIAMENAVAGAGDILQPMETPSSRESALERDYLQAQVAPSERADSRRAQEVAAARTGLIADAEAAAAVQRQAAKLAWEETYQMPYSEEAAKDIAEQVRKNDEDADMMADLSDIREAMDAKLAEVEQFYPQAKAMIDPSDVAGTSAVAQQKRALQAEQERIRQRFLLDMNHLLTVRTRRNIEMGKKGQADPLSEADIAGSPLGLK